MCVYIYIYIYTHTHTHTYIYKGIYVCICIVKTNSSVKQYIGATEGTIKLSFTNRNYSSNTSSSSYIWHPKYMNISPTITLEILKLASVYKTSKKCLLCLHEKLANITYPSQNTLLKKKSEILSKYKHESKHLSQFDPYT